ncbi:hypothetical protein LTR53_000643 [Teratosphaeriaceae sp. CCFEE 6253]|nr:hypothetical protein LTR53_000643 [Teratosphaeriaceae sp. CCFEE 6253]
MTCPKAPSAQAATVISVVMFRFRHTSIDTSSTHAVAISLSQWPGHDCEAVGCGISDPRTGREDRTVADAVLHRKRVSHFYDNAMIAASETFQPDPQDALSQSGRRRSGRYSYENVEIEQPEAESHDLRATIGIKTKRISAAREAVIGSTLKGLGSMLVEKALCLAEAGAAHHHIRKELFAQGNCPASIGERTHHCTRTVTEHPTENDSGRH